MKFALSLLAGLLAFASLAQPQTATVTAYSRSLSLTSVTANSGAIYNFDFTTTDHSTGLPLYVPEPGGTYLVSNELRPVSGQLGVYESDYLLLYAGTLTQYGYLTLNLPTLDTNRNGIPDVLEPALPMYTVVNGTGYSTWPSSNSFTMSLRFSRAAGNTAGGFSGIWSSSGSLIMGGTLQLPLIQGTATYSRGLQNQMELQLTRLRPNGTSTVLTGVVVYSASANVVSLPRFNLTDNTGQTYTTRATTLGRQGNRYLGNLKFLDGAPETPWPDYTDWRLELVDLNDNNTNGIPDLSDPAAVQIPTALVTVTTNGAGSVSPALSGENLVLDKTYRLTATPAVGNLFAGWSGDITSPSPTISFLLQSNLNLTANFVTNSFYPLRGTYYGLIWDTNGIANQTLGAITATVTERGTYSARIRLGGKSFSVSGSFDATGSATSAYAPANQAPIWLGLNLDLTNNTGLTGTISNEVWTAAIDANKASFNPASNPCTYAGRYTVVIPPDLGPLGGPGTNPPGLASVSGPAGAGYGTLNVNAAGRLSFYGSLADGTPVSQSTKVSATGDWGLYVSLYGGQGCLSSWATLTNTPDYLEDGVLTWVKPGTRARYYPEGFTNQVLLLLAPYSPPAPGTKLFEWTNGFAVFSGGNLGQGFSDTITVGDDNKLTSASTNHLSLRVLANGLFQGRVAPPESKRSFAFGGAWLQPTGFGVGYLLGTNQSAQVEIGPFILPIQTNQPPPPLPPGFPHPSTNTPSPLGQ